VNIFYIYHIFRTFKAFTHEANCCLRYVFIKCIDVQQLSQCQWIVNVLWHFMHNNLLPILIHTINTVSWRLPHCEHSKVLLWTYQICFGVLSHFGLIIVLCVLPHCQHTILLSFLFYYNVSMQFGFSNWHRYVHVLFMFYHIVSIAIC